MSEAVVLPDSSGKLLSYQFRTDPPDLTLDSEVTAGRSVYAEGSPDVALPATLELE